MSRWAETLLSRGTRGEGEILAPATLEKMWRPTMVVELPDGAIPGIPSKLAVGLTFFTWQQGVHRIVWHGGDDLGFSTSMMLAPDHQIAVVVLSNERFVPVHRLASSLISAALAPQRQ